MASWLFAPSPFDILVDKATSPSIPIGTQDIVTNLEIADEIRAKTIQPKQAVASLKRKLGDKNPNVQMLALKLTDSCIKNGGDQFLSEVASKDFIDNLVSVLRIQTVNHEVKKIGLDFFQQWALAFQSKPELSYVYEVYKSMKQDGINFPSPPTSIPTALLSTSTAPTWIDSEVCLRCRTAFSFTNRKHHCRNCGKVFDQQCSSHSMPLPWFGITDEVRVCDGCWSKSKTGGLAKEAVKQQQKAPQIPGKSAAPRSRADKENEDLQRAIALSLAESSSSSRTGFVPAEPYGAMSEPPLRGKDGRRLEGNDSNRHAAQENDEDDPDLLAAIEATLRDMRDAPSAPAGIPSEDVENTRAIRHGVNGPIGPREWELSPREEDAILTFSQTVEQASRLGERDLRRWGNEGELWGKARDMSGKVGHGVRVLEERQNTLFNMQTKLSSAVKLYDQLLTDQQAYAERQRTLHQASPYPQPYLQHQQQPPYGYPMHPQTAQPGWLPAHEPSSTLAPYPGWNPSQPSMYPSYNQYSPAQPTHHVAVPQSPTGYAPPAPWQQQHPQQQASSLYSNQTSSYPQQLSANSPYPPQPTSPYPQHVPSSPTVASTNLSKPVHAQPPPASYPQMAPPEPDFAPPSVVPSHAYGPSETQHIQSQQSFATAPVEEGSAPSFPSESQSSNPWDQSEPRVLCSSPDQTYPAQPPTIQSKASPRQQSMPAPSFPTVPSQPFEPFPNVPQGEFTHLPTEEEHRKENSAPEEGLLIAL
ncbi:Membrane trafficking and cell signaling protein HRS, contains VHS and FYVE domains [Phaffia rhodozyma]|uniref:Vacuolar protein sorting-associated protein 27 n=1 Tax=Phaffia rhodozyma TaxID=264483 RepID=A0A0F7SQR6_PHARH|nr:Membrane trafficking and cell signaling protein HRS, contains VHS and FYVE domains [Phaffia rhodozyma]